MKQAKKIYKLLKKIKEVVPQIAIKQYNPPEEEPNDPKENLMWTGNKRASKLARKGSKLSEDDTDIYECRY